MQRCSFCNAELPSYAHFCGRCGQVCSTTTISAKVRNKKHSPLVDNQEQQDTIVLRNFKAARERHSPPVDYREPRAVSTTGPLKSTRYDKALRHLPLPVQNAIVIVLNRASDPKPEESRSSFTGDQKADVSQSITWGWLPLLALMSALGTFSVAYAYTSARYGATGVEAFFWLGILLIFVPSMVRLILPAPSRFERLGLLCVVGMCFYLPQLLFDPLNFPSHDPFIHWRTAIDITSSGHLFTKNTLLPVSSFFPGLEIATNAFSTLSGLSIFHSAIIVLAVAHIVMVLSLFMLFELITKSSRVAGIATMLYMTNPHFLFFDVGFSYESLALPLAIFMLFTMARHEILGKDNRGTILITWIALGATIITHHLTSYIFDGFLLLWVVIYAFQKPARVLRSDLTKTALLGIILSLAWISLKGNPVVGYLTSYFESALSELGRILTGTNSARMLFVSYSGQPTPLWERLMAIASVFLILVCLPFGLLCLWQRYRYNTLVCMLGCVAFFYPLSHVFRFTNFGSEIADRSSAFLFISLAFVLAIFIAQFWPTRRLSWRQTSLITCAISLILLGGIVLAVGPPWELLPGPYLVGAGDRSIEPQGIQAALWAYSHLGSNNRIATDRTNQELMDTYGDQYIVTSLSDNIDVSPVFFSLSLGPNEVAILRTAKIHYLVVDLRLSQSLPSIGYYFEPGEPGSFQRTAPIPLKALTKFDTIPQVNRVFDSGDIAIYDVGGLVNASEKP